MRPHWTKIKHFFFSALFIILTLRTMRWLHKTYARICELDYDYVVVVPTGRLYAAGNTVDYEPIDSRRFTINCTHDGILYVHREFIELDDCQFEEIFRTGVRMKSVGWVWQLKKLNRSLKRNGFYIKRQRENLERSRKGIM